MSDWDEYEAMRFRPPYSKEEEEKLDLHDFPGLSKALAESAKREGFANAACRMPFPSEEAITSRWYAEKEREYYEGLISRLCGRLASQRLKDAQASAFNMFRGTLAGASMVHAENGNHEAAAAMAKFVNVDSEDGGQ